MYFDPVEPTGFPQHFADHSEEWPLLILDPDVLRIMHELTDLGRH